MIKITGFAIIAAAVLTVSGAFAGDMAGGKGCCTKGVANADGKGMCTNLALLKLNDDQKSKIEAWQQDYNLRLPHSSLDNPRLSARFYEALCNHSALRQLAV